MANVSDKRSGEIIRKVFEVLVEKPDGMQAKEIIASAERLLELTEFEKSYYPKAPNVRRFDKILRFNTIGPVKAGWLIKSKGIWTLTEEGRKAYKSITDPEKFVKEARRLYYKWKESQQEDLDEEPEDSPETASSFEEAEENAWIEIQEYLLSMPPYDFQGMVAALLRAMGYHVDWISPPGPDGGLDIIAYTDPLGTKLPRIKVQVKRRSDKINVDGLRSFMALLGDQDIGLFVSIGGFTSDAEAESRKQEKRRITLLDLQRLYDLWVDHYDKIDEPDKAYLPLKPVYYLAPQK